MKKEVKIINNPDYIWRTARWNTGKCEICAYPIRQREKYFGKINNTDKRRHAKCHQFIFNEKNL